jgi:pilus assembly protein CpaF
MDTCTAPTRSVASPTAQQVHAPLALFERLLGDAITGWLRDPHVNEVMINRPDDIWLERHGEFRRLPVTLTPAAVRGALQVAASIARTTLGLAEGERPFVNARVGDARVAGAIMPVAAGGDCLAIRRPSAVARRLQDYALAGGFRYLSHSTTASDVAVPQPNGRSRRVSFDRTLSDLILEGANVLIAGVPSGGKTTALRALLDCLPCERRVIVVEDTPELPLPTTNGVSLVAHPEQGVSLRELVRLSLRLRPDLIVVGELRGPEAADFVTAMNSGAKAMATLHADGALEALYKLEGLVMQAHDITSHAAVRQTVAQLVDVVLHLGRVGAERGLFLAAKRVVGLDAQGDYCLFDL